MILTIALLLAFSTPESSYHSQDNDIRLFRWVAETGKSTVVRANVTKALGLGERDILVTERGFRQAGEKFTHVIAIIMEPPAPDSVIIARIDETNGAGITWYCSPLGQLLLTVILNDAGKVELVPNEKYHTDFSAEKLYFLQQFLKHDEVSRSLSGANDQPSLVALSLPFRTNARPKSVLGSELMAVCSAPWILIVIAILFWYAVQPIKRSRS